MGSSGFHEPRVAAYPAAFNSCSYLSRKAATNERMGIGLSQTDYKDQARTFSVIRGQKSYQKTRRLKESRIIGLRPSWNGLR